MSVSTYNHTTGEQITNNQLRRLTIEAAKYNGLSVGDQLLAEEIIAQGKANGYDEREIRSWLHQEGYTIAESIQVPPQGAAFGKLWAKAPNTTHQFLESFRNWCKNKQEMRRKEYDDGTYQHKVEHSYSYKGERKKFAQFKDVERAFIEEYDKFTTILITYTKPRQEGQSVVDHAKSFYPRSVRRKRRDCIKKTGYWEEYAGVSLLAPKDVAPTPTAQATHAHDAILIPTFIPSESFDPLRSVDGVDVSIRYHRSDKVSAPSAINRLDLEQERGATTALAQEVGANLPVFTAIESYRDKMEAEASPNSARYKATLDARDCPAYVERWCAHISAGQDGEHDTNGIDRWRPLGKFNELSNEMKERRDYGAMGIGGKDSDEEPDSDENPTLSVEGTDLSTKEREFVTAYIDADASIEREVIESNIEENINALGGVARIDVLVEAIQSSACGAE